MKPPSLNTGLEACLERKVDTMWIVEVLNAYGLAFVKFVGTTVLKQRTTNSNRQDFAVCEWQMNKTMQLSESLIVCNMFRIFLSLKIQLP